MSRRCLWSRVINNTITGAIDYFWRDGHHLELSIGRHIIAGWKRIRNSWGLSPIKQQHSLFYQMHRTTNGAIILMRLALAKLVITIFWVNMNTAKIHINFGPLFFLFIAYTVICKNTVHCSQDHTVYERIKADIFTNKNTQHLTSCF